MFVLGTAVRHCNDEKGWLPPELFNCTTITFSQLKKLVPISHILPLNMVEWLKSVSYPSLENFWH